MRTFRLTDMQPRLAIRSMLICVGEIWSRLPVGLMRSVINCSENYPVFIRVIVLKSITGKKIFQARTEIPDISILWMRRRI